MSCQHKSLNLFKSLKEDNLSAFAKIYTSYSKQILNFAFSFSLRKEDAEEIVQDTFIKLWTKRGNINENRSVESFLFTISKNLIIDKIRKITLDKGHLALYFSEKEAVMNKSVEEKVNFEELQSILTDIISALPTKRRRIFELNRFHDMTYKQIADSLNISSGTVEKQMNLALKTIKVKLAHYDIVICMFILVHWPVSS